MSRHVDAEPIGQVETNAAGRFPPFLDVSAATAKLKPPEPLLEASARFSR